MQCVIDGKPYTYLNQIRDDAPVRRSFNALAWETFRLSMETWYQAGYWRECYIPHALLEGDRVVANVSVNIMDMRLLGQPRRYIQLGTVMTDPGYRRRGLSRYLMEAILTEWTERCDGLYLYANDSVLDFYPKFGYRRAEEQEFSLPVPGGPGAGRRLCLDDPADRALFQRRIRQGNRFSALSQRDCESLVMFYCGQELKDCVYDLPAWDAAAVLEEEGEVLLCHDVFGGGSLPLAELLSQLARPETRRVSLGFTPVETEGLDCAPLREEDTTFFWHQSHPLPFHGPMRFPTLSHT